MTKQEHYVYIFFRPDGRPCYVGKGKGNRWDVHERRTHNRYLARIIAKAGGVLPKVKIRENLTNAEACETEIAFIAAIGRVANGGPLVNMTDGGEGTVGMIHGFEWRATRSLRAKETWNDPEYRATQAAKKIGNKNSKKPHVLSEEWRQELTRRMMGNSFTKGMKLPDSMRSKIRAKWQDSEWRAKMIETRRLSGMYSPERVAERVAVRMARYPKKVKILVPRVQKKGKDHHWYGRSHGEAARKKLSEQRKGSGNPMYGKSGADSPRAKAVRCISDGQVFVTITKAVQWLRTIGYEKAVGGNIVSCCKGKLKTSYGRVWQYVEPECV